jgi:hypothetical protein
MDSTPATWPDLIASAVDKIARIYEEITYELVDMKVTVPGGTSETAKSATWIFNGALRVRVKLTNP